MYSKTNGPEAAFKDRVMRFSMANELSNQFPVFKIYFTLTNLSSSVDGFGSKSIRCQVVRKSNGASQQRDTLLHVQVPIQNFAVHPLRLTLNETDAALFTCSADGFPSPTITWTNTQGHMVGHGTSYYRIPAVNRRMSGMYTCTVTDGCGQNYTKSAILTVQYKPEKTKLIKLAPSGNVSDRYSTYAFRCIASAYPPVTSYTIYTNGIKRYTGTGIYYGYTHMLGAAEFTCEPHSAAGYGANSTVTIITIVDGHHFFPFNYLSGGGTVPEGSSLSFYCYLDLWHGNITWIKNGKRMNTVTTFYELRFDPVTRKDEGFYACGYIFNGVEYTVRHITHLTVEYKPEKTQLHSLGSSYCHGSAIPLYCTAVAKPADIRYFLRINNQPLANNTIGLFNVSLSRLGYHLYTCAPSNKVGEGEHRSVRIQVQEPLTSASILPINGTRFTEKSTVQLTCAANEVDSYEIRWTKDGVLVGEGQTLMIQSINRTDEGVYTCTINNTCNEVSAVTYIGVDYVNMDQQTLKCSSSPGFIILSLETNTASPPNITCNSGHASYRGLVAHSNGSVISYRVDLPDSDVSEVKCRAEGFPGTENTYTIAVADSEYIRNGSFRVTNARYPPSDAIKGKIIKSIKECFDAACLRSLSVTYRDGSLVVDVSLVITANITDPFLSVKDTLLHKTKFYGLSVDPSSIEMSALAYLTVTKLEKRSVEVVNQEPAVSGLAVMVALLFVSNCATIIYFLKCKKSGTEERPRPNVDGREKNSQTQSITMQEGPFSSLPTEGQAGAQPGGSFESMGQLPYLERNASPEYDTVTPTKTVTQHNQAHVTRPKIFSKSYHESSTSLSRANTPLKQLHNTKAIKEKIEKPGYVTMAANDVTASTGARDQEPSAMYQSLDSVFVNEAQYASLTPHTCASTDHMAFVYENLGRDSAKETDFCHHLDVHQQESSHANATTA